MMFGIIELHRATDPEGEDKVTVRLSDIVQVGQITQREHRMMTADMVTQSDPGCVITLIVGDHLNILQVKEPYHHVVDMWQQIYVPIGVFKELGG